MVQIFRVIFDVEIFKSCHDLVPLGIVSDTVLNQDVDESTLIPQQWKCFSAIIPSVVNKKTESRRTYLCICSAKIKTFNITSSELFSLSRLLLSRSICGSKYGYLKTLLPAQHQFTATATAIKRIIEIREDFVTLAQEMLRGRNSLSRA